MKNTNNIFRDFGYKRYVIELLIYLNNKGLSGNTEF